MDGYDDDDWGGYCMDDDLGLPEDGVGLECLDDEERPGMALGSKVVDSDGKAYWVSTRRNRIKYAVPYSEKAFQRMPQGKKESMKEERGPVALPDGTFGYVNAKGVLRYYDDLGPTERKRVDDWYYDVYQYYNPDEITLEEHHKANPRRPARSGGPPGSRQGGSQPGSRQGGPQRAGPRQGGPERAAQSRPAPVRPAQAASTRAPAAPAPAPPAASRQPQGGQVKIKIPQKFYNRIQYKSELKGYVAIIEKELQIKPFMLPFLPGSMSKDMLPEERDSFMTSIMLYAYAYAEPTIAQFTSRNQIRLPSSYMKSMQDKAAFRDWEAKTLDKISKQVPERFPVRNWTPKMTDSELQEYTAYTTMLLMYLRKRAPASGARPPPAAPAPAAAARPPGPAPAPAQDRGLTDKEKNMPVVRALLKFESAMGDYMRKYDKRQFPTSEEVISFGLERMSEELQKYISKFVSDASPEPLLTAIGHLMSDGSDDAVDILSQNLDTKDSLSLRILAMLIANPSLNTSRKSGLEIINVWNSLMPTVSNIKNKVIRHHRNWAGKLEQQKKESQVAAAISQATGVPVQTIPQATEAIARMVRENQELPRMPPSAIEPLMHALFQSIQEQKDGPPLALTGTPEEVAAHLLQHEFGQLKQNLWKMIWLTDDFKAALKSYRAREKQKGGPVDRPVVIQGEPGQRRGAFSSYSRRPSVLFDSSRVVTPLPASDYSVPGFGEVSVRPAPARVEDVPLPQREKFRPVVPPAPSESGESRPVSVASGRVTPSRPASAASVRSLPSRPGSVPAAAGERGGRASRAGSAGPRSRSASGERRVRSASRSRSPGRNLMSESEKERRRRDLIDALASTTDLNEIKRLYDELDEFMGSSMSPAEISELKIKMRQRIDFLNLSKKCGD